MDGTNDIEYEGIGGVGGVGDIRVRSERCFRDHSPSDTLISLSDNGQTLYSSPTPAFSHGAQGLPTLSLPLHGQDGAIDSKLPTTPSKLSHDALEKHQDAPPHVEDVSFPLARFRRDTQSHEQLALGVSLAISAQNPRLASSPLSPATGTQGQERVSSRASFSSTHLTLNPLPAKNSETSAAELREVLDVMGKPEWKDNVPLEEQVQYLLRATNLKRRVRSETHPRESRIPKVRKRDRSGKYASRY
ncbi:hypothetical protein GGR53DRAFT_13344 [Hypoxylon sp. FL1150]|nr:hypothetical protein GGR53DRAFT_13344 [Hypoxylon sp. FL1150]